MGTGSNKHVGLNALISLFSSSCPIVVKHCSFSLGVVNEAEVLDAVEPKFCYCISDVIYFISEEIHKVITIKL